jgi:hypothetical protein
MKTLCDFPSAKVTRHKEIIVRSIAVIVLLACNCFASSDRPSTADDDAKRNSDYEARCKAPGVIRCVGFDSDNEVSGHVSPPGSGTTPPKLDFAVKSSGAGSLRFMIPSSSPADSSGNFWLDFSDDLSKQFGEGEEFFVQWRQRFSVDFLKSMFEGSNGWKQVIVGEGDRPGHTAYSCTQLEVVAQNTYMRGIPQLYHSCGSKDGNYDALSITAGNSIFLQNAVGCEYGTIRFPPCVPYKAEQWMTFQIHIKVGHWYHNDHKYRHDSTVQLWVAEEGKPSKLVIDFNPAKGTGYDLANTDPSAKYGKLWLLPYNTGKNPGKLYPVGYTWYDELIISRARIADPASN